MRGIRDLISKKIIALNFSKWEKGLFANGESEKAAEFSDKKSPGALIIVYITLVALILPALLPLDKSEASAQTNITKTSSSDWNQGSNSGITTVSDEIKISSATGWSDDSYAFRKPIDVTALSANSITKGHTLNVAGVGSGTFDGSGDWFDVGTNFNETLPVTIEAWVNLKAWNSQIFSSKETVTSNYNGFWMYVDGAGKVFLSYGDNTGQLSSARRSKYGDTVVALNTWTHITGVIRGATDMSIYINGVDANGTYSGAGGNMANNLSSSGRIGWRNIAVNPMMNGNIDELRVWSKARTQGEITADMYKEISAQANLDAYYKFNQTAGSLADDSGNSHTGTIGGNADYAPYSNVWGGINTKALIDAGKLRSDANDLRMFYGSSEIERELIPATGKTLSTSEATQILFKAQAAVSAGQTDQNYSIYYGDSDAVDPIANVYEKKFRTKNAYITPYDGSDSNYLQYNGDNVPTNGDGTIEFWYKFSNAGSRRAETRSIFKGEDTENVWSLWNDRWGYRLFAYIGGVALMPSDPGNIKDGRGWNHTVITWHNTDTNSQIRMYENNVLTASVDDGTKITSWPNYMKFLDNSSSYDGVELGLFAVFNTAKDSTWVSSEFTRSSSVPIADGLRDSSATFIHNFDGSGLDASSVNGGFASGTTTAVSQGVIMSGDYRQGDTNDERFGNSWVSGIYNWYDNFDNVGVKSPGINEFGKINVVSNELVLKNAQHALVNQGSTAMPTNYRLDVSAKGTQPEILFNHQDKTGWWGNAMCTINVTNNGYNQTDLLYPRDAAKGFLSGNTSKYYLGIYNGFTPKYLQFDFQTAGNYAGVAWEYWNGSAWTVFTPSADSTSNFSQNGIVDISNIIPSFGANPAADGACSWPSNYSVVRISASTVTTPATLNQINRVNDFAKLAFSATTNVISGDAHNSAGTYNAARAVDAFKQLGMRRVGTGVQAYIEGYRTLNTTTNAVFDSNLLGLSATTGATFDNLKVYKALANEPTTSAQSEVAKYTLGTGNTYFSPTSTAVGSGIINLGWIGSWGTPKGFSANVIVPTNTSIEFKVRSSAVAGSNDADWTDWATVGTATTTGEFSIATASMPNITLGLNKYLQIKATLITTDGLNTPTLSDYSIYYVADTDPPANPTVNTLTVNGSAVLSGGWTSSSGAVLATFSGATDPGTESGVAGYYIYLGTSATADPQVDGAYQAHVGAVNDAQTYASTISISDDGKYYYLIVASKDGANNVATKSTLFQFGYDKTLPIKPSFVSANPPGFTTVNSFDFSWPAGSDPAGANGASGVKYYEYRRGNTGTWSHTLDANQVTVSDIAAYQEGINVFYVRTVDKAGSASLSYAQASYYWSGSAPSKPTSLLVDPETSDSNDFTISWDKPVVDDGDPSVTGYYYSINEAPTTNNVTYVASTADHVSIGPDHFATQQGQNTFYVVAANELGNRSFESAYVASATFNCQTPAPPIPANVSISDTTNRAYSIYSLTTKWSAGTGQNQASFDHYLIERSIDGVNFTELATISSVAYIDASNLDNATTYYYRIKAVDDAGSTSAASTIISKIPTGKYQNPPTYLSNPSVSDIKSSSANIAWTTDRASNSIIRYGKKLDDLSASSGQLDSVQNHIVNLLGLEPSTTYYFKAQSLDSDRDYSPEEAYSESKSFTTLSSPAISNVNVSNITLTTADITWETTTLAMSSLYYGVNSSFNNKLDDMSGSNTTKHSVKITDLANSTRYAFKISGNDTDNNELNSDMYYFETLPMPKVENLKIDVLKDKARPSVRISWTTNVATSSIVKYSSSDSDGKESVKAKLVTEHEIIIDNLSDQTNYKITATGMDAIGNLTSGVSSSVVTPQDTRAPEISEITIETSNVGLNRQDKAQVVVSWKTDEPSTSQVEYGVGLEGESYERQSNADNNLATSHVVILSDLEPTSPYHLRINSQDKSGNLAKSGSQVVVSSEVPRSVLKVLLNALQQAFGWIKI